jgi:hypothetical protein
VRRLETAQYEFALRDEARLRGLFDRVLRASPSSSQEQDALREGVCSLVHRAKAEGRQVETVIVALKDIFAIPDRPNRGFMGDEDTPPAVLLLRRVVRWCIKEYYGKGTDVPVSDA